MKAEQPRAVGKRVELRREEDQLAWLARKAPGLGFALVNFRVLPSDREAPATRADPGGRLHGENSQGNRITLATARFEGVLDVVDAGRLRETIAAGVGAGKAFGCGLLSLAPARES